MQIAPNNCSRACCERILFLSLLAVSRSQCWHARVNAKSISEKSWKQNIFFVSPTPIKFACEIIGMCRGILLCSVRAVKFELVFAERFYYYT